MYYCDRPDMWGDNFWYTGVTSSQPTRMFANNHNRFTFFELWALGNQWFALHDSLGTSIGSGVNSYPVTYTGRQQYSAPSNKWIRVNPYDDDKMSLYSDAIRIHDHSAFKITPRILSPSDDDYIPSRVNNPHITNPITQPPTRVYLMRSNHESYEKGKYLQWRYLSFNWDRYAALADQNTALSDHACWVSILPEYDPMVDYLLGK